MKLLDENELWEAEVKYQIISPGFAIRVRELLVAYNTLAAQQGVVRPEQSSFWLCPSCHITNAAFRSVCSECGTDNPHNHGGTGIGSL